MPRSNQVSIFDITVEKIIKNAHFHTENERLIKPLLRAVQSETLSSAARLSVDETDPLLCVTGLPGFCSERSRRRTNTIIVTILLFYENSNTVLARSVPVRKKSVNKAVRGVGSGFGR